MENYEFIWLKLVNVFDCGVFCIIAIVIQNLIFKPSSDLVIVCTGTWAQQKQQLFIAKFLIKPKHC